MIARGHHLQEDRLLDCYLAERGGEPLDPPAAEHLADCGDCGARYSELVRVMDAVRAEADAETDEIFTAERLRAQQQQIGRRLEQVGRPAHILRFPGQLVSRRMAASAARGVTRWVYAAAAAGLVVGVGLGALYDLESHRMQRPHPIATGRPPAAARSSAPVAVATDGVIPPPEAADEAFLSELEVALERPRIRELQPFDALTPHVREIADRSR